MDAILDGLQEDFKALCDRTDFENKLTALKKSGDKSDRPSKLRKLFDLFDLCGIEYERGKDNAYYESLVRKAKIPDFSEIEDRMLLALFARYEAYPTPEDYMKRIVDRLSNEEDGWEEDTLRLRILKQFIKYGNYLAAAGYGGRKSIVDYVKGKTGKKKLSDEEVPADLDDGVFALLETASKDQKKPDGKFGLLKTADDLAAGKFRAEGATKRSLYMFAMVYGMTYYSGDADSAEILDYKTDIATNLFRDYYANNLMRYISEVYRGRRSEFELDPSGQGINYKNFAEMIYLYYISKDYSPQNKIQLSSKMIDRVRERQFKQGKPEASEERDTWLYQELFSEDILRKPEDEFETFLCENYNCDTYDSSRGTTTGVLQVEAEQNSAFAEYQAILKSLKRRGVSLESCNYGLWFTDVAAFKKKGLENVCDRKKELDREKFEEFMELLLAINSFIGYTVGEAASVLNTEQEWAEPSKAKTKALYVSSPSAITRTSLIVAYYYYYNAVHENDDSDKLKSFEEVFNTFQADINPKLYGAGYQPLSGKNIFDVLVAFSSYAYLNM